MKRTQRSKQKTETGEIVLQDGTVISKWFYQPYSERPIPKNYAEWNQPFTYTRNPEREKLLKKISDAKKRSSYCSAQLLDARNRKLDTSVVTSPTTDQTVSQLKETEASELCVLSTGAEAGHPARNKEVDPRLATRKPTETKAIELHATDPDDTQIGDKSAICPTDSLKSISSQMPYNRPEDTVKYGVMSKIVAERKLDSEIETHFESEAVKIASQSIAQSARSNRIQRQAGFIGNKSALPHRQNSKLKAKKKTKISFLSTKPLWPGYPFVDEYGKLVRPIMSQAERNAARQTLQRTDLNHANCVIPTPSDVSFTYVDESN